MQVNLERGSGALPKRVWSKEGAAGDDPKETKRPKDRLTPRGGGDHNKENNVHLWYSLSHSTPFTHYGVFAYLIKQHLHWIAAWASLPGPRDGIRRRRPMGKRGAGPGWGRRATEEALGGRVVGAGASASSDPGRKSGNPDGNVRGCDESWTRLTFVRSAVWRWCEAVIRILLTFCVWL